MTYSTNELRALLTRYYRDDANIISDVDFKEILTFIEWIEHDIEGES